jgi:hypothetical protein
VPQIPLEDLINADFSPEIPSVVEYRDCPGCPPIGVEWIPSVPMAPSIPIPTIPLLPSH